MAARDDGTDSVASLHAGADVCIRGTDVGLVAAYIQSVARRRGLLLTTLVGGPGAGVVTRHDSGYQLDVAV